jgi:hypothetical protein
MLADACSLLSMGPPMSQQRRRKQKGERKNKTHPKIAASRYKFNLLHGEFSSFRDGRLRVFSLFFLKKNFSDSTLTVHKRQETKHSQQQLSFFSPFFFGAFLFCAQTNLNT